MIAAFSWASFKMSGGIWFATVDAMPGLEGIADLLPTNLLRGLVALDDPEGLLCFELSAMAGESRVVVSDDNNVPLNEILASDL